MEADAYHTNSSERLLNLYSSAVEEFCPFGLGYLAPSLTRFLGMSQRDMKVGPIETKMIGIDRKALDQIFDDFL